MLFSKAAGISADTPVPLVTPRGFARPDLAASPRTGLTREHWEAAADLLVDGAWRYANQAGSLIQLPGRPSISGSRSDGLEGFARLFLLASFRIRGASGAGTEHLAQLFTGGIRAGVASKRRSASWPSPVRTKQALVEAASISMALQLTQPWVWDKLEDQFQDLLCNWLTQCFEVEPVNNNWQLFPVVIAGFLDSVGRATTVSKTARRRGLERIEAWYQGDGWYSDGPGRSFDHYNGWAFHFYPMLQAYLTNDAELLAIYGPRLHRFLHDYSRLFDANGAPLYQGRSIIYRFGAVAPLLLGSISGYSPITPGATRRIASGSMDHFFRRGAAQGGVLSLGWYSEGDAAIQNYSGPGSPYWASKAFVGLLAPATHAVWSDREEAAPVEVGDFVTPLGHTGLLAQGTSSDGIVRVHNHGVDNHPNRLRSTSLDSDQYSRLSYSTRTAPVSVNGYQNNQFNLIIDNQVLNRGVITPTGSGDGWAASAQTPYRVRQARYVYILNKVICPFVLPPVAPDARMRIDAVSLANGEIEVHAWRITGARHARFRATGWASHHSGDVRSSQVADREIHLQATPGGELSRLAILAGFEHISTVSGAQITPFGTHVTIPFAEGSLTSQACIFAIASSLSVSESSENLLNSVGVELTEDGLVVNWSDRQQSVEFSPTRVKRCADVEKTRHC